MKKLIVGKSQIQGKGIFTLEPIKKGEHIAFIQGRLVKKKIHNKKEAQSIPLWYGITDIWWIDPQDTIWRYFNHSCEPNTAIIGTKKLIALKNISANSEITFDYSMTDGDPLWEMSCSCNSASCRKKIVAIQRLPEQVFKKHMPHIPRFFIKLRQRSVH